jgi:hypothetical protein
LELAIPTTSSHVQPELTSVQRDVLTPLLHAKYLCTKRTLLAIAGHTDRLMHQLIVFSRTLIFKQSGHEPKNRLSVNTQLKRRGNDMKAFPRWIKRGTEALVYAKAQGSMDANRLCFIFWMVAIFSSRPARKGEEYRSLS